MKVYREARTEFKIRWNGFNVVSAGSFIFHRWNAPFGKGFRMYGFRVLGVEFDWFYTPALTD
jgi:hypothetical protein